MMEATIVVDLFMADSVTGAVAAEGSVLAVALNAVGLPIRLNAEDAEDAESAGDTQRRSNLQVCGRSCGVWFLDAVPKYMPMVDC